MRGNPFAGHPYGLLRRAQCIGAVFLINTLLFAPVFAKDTSAILHNSGQPIPRFVALKSSEVNMRVGPGERYPIVWVYRRKNWPVEVVEEFGHWRKIRDFEGTQGWVHKTLLAGIRSAIILKERTPLLSAPDESSGIIVQIDPLVAGVIQECSPNWCRLMFGNSIGWIARTKLWGIYDNEDLSEKD